MIKPFEPRELIARVRSILRRRGDSAEGGPAERAIAQFVGWQFDTGRTSL